MAKNKMQILPNPTYLICLTISIFVRPNRSLIITYSKILGSHVTFFLPIGKQETWWSCDMETYSWWRQHKGGRRRTGSLSSSAGTPCGSQCPALTVPGRSRGESGTSLPASCPGVSWQVESETMIERMVGWLVGWLVDWLVDWLIDWLMADWLIISLYPTMKVKYGWEGFTLMVNMPRWFLCIQSVAWFYQRQCSGYSDFFLIDSDIHRHKQADCSSKAHSIIENNKRSETKNVQFQVTCCVCCLYNIQASEIVIKYFRKLK